MVDTRHRTIALGETEIMGGRPTDRSGIEAHVLSYDKGGSARLKTPGAVAALTA